MTSPNRLYSQENTGMCGICGVAYLEPERQVNHVELKRMTESLHHRGPDSRGFHAGAGIGLGITRLSIIDIETGDQPIPNEDGTLTLICNGEIYNQRELREELIAAGHRFHTQSDVEVIVHLYEDHGVDCLRHLRGMFAFALWDAPLRRLMLARDRLGIKPLHYSITGEACYFGSEQKAILAADRIERRLDVHALADVFTLGFARTPKTLFTGIRRLPPAHYLLYEDGEAKLHEYWDLDFTPRDEVRFNPAEWAEALLEQLNESVRLHLMSDVPLGAWLSAGLDSSTIVALMSRHSDDAIHTFTLAFEHPDFDESRSRRMLDEFPGYNLTSHRSICTAQDIRLLPKALWHCEDPLSSVAEIPRMLLAATAAERVKVVLTGEGADEIFGGYDYFRVDKALRPLARLPLGLRRLLGAAGARRHQRASRVHVGPAEMRMERYIRLTAPLNLDDGLLSDDVRHLLAGSADDGSGELRLPDGFSDWHPFSQLQYYETKIRLPDRIELSLDRASMACSLEARVPFLDHKLAEFCARIPPSLKMRRLQEKHILRQALRGVLPAEILRRKKRGLVSPVQHWLREPLPDFAAELLSEEQLRRKAYFDPAAISRLRADFNRGDASRNRALMAVLLVQLWDDLFMRRGNERSPI